jgi:hypothetical protein
MWRTCRLAARPAIRDNSTTLGNDDDPSKELALYQAPGDDPGLLVGEDRDGSLHVFRAERLGWRSRTPFSGAPGALERIPILIAKHTGWPGDVATGVWAVKVASEEDFIAAPPTGLLAAITIEGTPVLEVSRDRVVLLVEPDLDSTDAEHELATAFDVRVARDLRQAIAILEDTEVCAVISHSLISTGLEHFQHPKVLWLRAPTAARIVLAVDPSASQVPAGATAALGEGWEAGSLLAVVEWALTQSMPAVTDPEMQAMKDSTGTD